MWAALLEGLGGAEAGAAAGAAEGGAAESTLSRVGNAASITGGSGDNKRSNAFPAFTAADAGQAESRLSQFSIGRNA